MILNTILLIFFFLQIKYKATSVTNTRENTVQIITKPQLLDEISESDEDCIRNYQKTEIDILIEYVENLIDRLNILSHNDREFSEIEYKNANILMKMFIIINSRLNGVEYVYRPNIIKYLNVLFVLLKTKTFDSETLAAMRTIEEYLTIHEKIFKDRRKAIQLYIKPAPPSQS